MNYITVIREMVQAVQDVAAAITALADAYREVRS